MDPGALRSVNDEQRTTPPRPLSPPRTQPRAAPCCTETIVPSQQSLDCRGGNEPMSQPAHLPSAGAPAAQRSDRASAVPPQPVHVDPSILRFATSTSGQRLKQQFSTCANSLTALYQESSHAYASGVRDARDEIHQYVLSVVRDGGGSREQSLGSCVVTSPAVQQVERRTMSVSATQRGERVLNNRDGRSRRWIDADELLTFLCLSTLRAEGDAHRSSVGRSSGGDRSSDRPVGWGADVAHTFGRRRPRDHSASWAERREE